MVIVESKARQWLLFFVMLLVAMWLGMGDVLANTENCTAHVDMSTNTAAGQGVVSAVMQTIIGLLDNTSKALYETVIHEDSAFIQARNAAILLAVIIYGVMIIFNLANFKPGEILGLLFKIGMIMLFTSPNGWQFFNAFVGDFFFGTMIEMIEIFNGQTAATTSAGYIGQASTTDRLIAPLSMFNWPMARVISTQFFITIIASLALPTYGFIIALLLLWGGFNLIRALVMALFTYIRCIVGLWFLFALAPIFFLLLLFGRTRNLFEGWMNMVVQFTLEPILLFAFLAFFVTITTSSLGELMKVNWCWESMKGVSTGTTSEIWWWRATNVYSNITDSYQAVNGGEWGVSGNFNIDGTLNEKVGPFPIDVSDVMFFLLSSYVAHQYANFVPAIAGELSAGGLRLSVNGEAARNYFSSRGWTPQKIAANGGGALKQQLR